MSTAIGEKRLSTKRAERDDRQRARQSKAHPDCRSTTIKLTVTQISLALSSGRDNHPPAATAEMTILIVAVFPSRLSRYSPRSQPRRWVRLRSWRQSESHDHEWSECRADARHHSLWGSSPAAPDRVDISSGPVLRASPPTMLPGPAPRCEQTSSHPHPVHPH